MNYQEAEQKPVGRCARGRRLERNTYLERQDFSDTIAVRLHSTNIITFHKDGRIDVNTGGWNTPTTRDRMAYLPAPWRISGYRGATVLHKRGGAFEDGWILDNSAHISPRGKVTGAAKTFREHLAEVRKADNERNRVRGRERYWLRKARNGEPAKGLTVATIMTEENVSVRVAKMRVYGLERFLLEAGAKVIDEQMGYQLLDFELGQWRRIRALKMVCPSTQATYISPVEPRLETIPAALDWMFQTTDYLGQVTNQT